MPDAAGLGRATVNLKDAQCDTLGDNGGLAWGDSFRVSLDRFTYRHAEGVGEASGASLLSLSPLSHWKVRREWLWQQMRGLNEPRNRRPRDLSEYKPQPFEQLIRVARSSGDEQMASSIEIEKNIIEGKIFAQASWRTFAALGVAGAAASALLNGVGTLLDVVLIVGIGLLVGFAPRIASFLFHWLFGYLRRPLRATLTLIGSIVIGFVGVHIANENYRMVIELTPTASTFDEAHARLGTPLNREGVASNMECGKEINELLYAIDVFIPLIDLRQEGRCTAGTVAGKETRSPEDQPAGWWARQMADAYARTILSQSFWEISKALYGVLGWIMVSLSILTFARLDRKSGQN
ncbi:MAG: hypothetical protein EOP61_29445 [Sphingomonadales bacterium]|nr:MAG: hypothetical protein EOP61_29445 [Sphingomonadales bacterium]